MENCFCCKKECFLELLRSDDATDETNFCPECFQFKVKCLSNEKEYVCCKYDEKLDTRMFNYDTTYYSLNNSDYCLYACLHAEPCLICSNPVFFIERDDIAEDLRIGDNNYDICITCQKEEIPKYFYYSHPGFADLNTDLETYFDLIASTNKLKKENEQLKGWRKEFLKEKLPLPKAIIGVICDFL